MAELNPIPPSGSQGEDGNPNNQPTQLNDQSFNLENLGEQTVMSDQDNTTEIPTTDPAMITTDNLDVQLPTVGSVEVTDTNLDPSAAITATATEESPVIESDLTPAMPLPHPVPNSANVVSLEPEVTTPIEEAQEPQSEGAFSAEANSEASLTTSLEPTPELTETPESTDDLSVNSPVSEELPLPAIPENSENNLTDSFPAAAAIEQTVAAAEAEEPLESAVDQPLSEEEINARMGVTASSGSKWKLWSVIGGTALIAIFGFFIFFRSGAPTDSSLYQGKFTPDLSNVDKACKAKRTAFKKAVDDYNNETDPDRKKELGAVVHSQGTNLCLTDYDPDPATAACSKALFSRLLILEYLGEKYPSTADEENAYRNKETKLGEIDAFIATNCSKDEICSTKGKLDEDSKKAAEKVLAKLNETEAGDKSSQDPKNAEPAKKAVGNGIEMKSENKQESGADIQAESKKTVPFDDIKVETEAGNKPLQDPKNAEPAKKAVVNGIEMKPENKQEPGADVQAESKKTVPFDDIKVETEAGNKPLQDPKDSAPAKKDLSNNLELNTEKKKEPMIDLNAELDNKLMEDIKVETEAGNKSLQDPKDPASTKKDLSNDLELNTEKKKEPIIDLNAESNNQLLNGAEIKTKSNNSTLEASAGNPASNKPINFGYASLFNSRDFQANAIAKESLNSTNLAVQSNNSIQFFAESKSHTLETMFPKALDSKNTTDFIRLNCQKDQQPPASPPADEQKCAAQKQEIKLLLEKINAATDAAKKAELRTQLKELLKVFTATDGCSPKLCGDINVVVNQITDSSSVSGVVEDNSSASLLPNDLPAGSLEGSSAEKLADTPPWWKGHELEIATTFCEKSPEKKPEDKQPTDDKKGSPKNQCTTACPDAGQLQDPATCECNKCADGYKINGYKQVGLARIPICEKEIACGLAREQYEQRVADYQNARSTGADEQELNNAFERVIKALESIHTNKESECRQDNVCEQLAEKMELTKKLSREIDFNKFEAESKKQGCDSTPSKTPDKSSDKNPDKKPNDQKPVGECAKTQTAINQAVEAYKKADKNDPSLVVDHRNEVKNAVEDHYVNQNCKTNTCSALQERIEIANSVEDYETEYLLTLDLLRENCLDCAKKKQRLTDYQDRLNVLRKASDIKPEVIEKLEEFVDRLREKVESDPKCQGKNTSSPPTKNTKPSAPTACTVAEKDSRAAKLEEIIKAFKASQNAEAKAAMKKEANLILTHHHSFTNAECKFTECQKLTQKKTLHNAFNEVADAALVQAKIDKQCPSTPPTNKKPNPPSNNNGNNKPPATCDSVKSKFNQTFAAYQKNTKDLTNAAKIIDLMLEMQQRCNDNICSLVPSIKDAIELAKANKLTSNQAASKAKLIEAKCPKPTPNPPSKNSNGKSIKKTGNLNDTKSNKVIDNQGSSNSNRSSSGSNGGSISDNRSTPIIINPGNTRSGSRTSATNSERNKAQERVRVLSIQLEDKEREVKDAQARASDAEERVNSAPASQRPQAEQKAAAARQELAQKKQERDTVKQAAGEAESKVKELDAARANLKGVAETGPEVLAYFAALVLGYAIWRRKLQQRLEE